MQKIVLCLLGLALFGCQSAPKDSTQVSIPVFPESREPASLRYMTSDCPNGTRPYPQEWNLTIKYDQVEKYVRGIGYAEGGGYYDMNVVGNCKLAQLRYDEAKNVLTCNGVVLAKSTEMFRVGGFEQVFFKMQTNPEHPVQIEGSCRTNQFSISFQ